jgi:hypothetical protein
MHFNNSIIFTHLKLSIYKFDKTDNDLKSNGGCQEGKTFGVKNEAEVC